MVVTLTGENSFLLNQELGKIVADFEAQHGDLAVERLDAEELESNRLIEAVTALPFLSEGKLVIIYKLSSNKQFCEKLEKIIAEIPEINTVIFVEPKFDKRQSFYKFLNKKTDFRNFSSGEANLLGDWIISYTREQGGVISRADSKYLLERIGPNQQMLANEINKLILYSKEISRQTIDLLTEVSLQSTTFQLLEAAFAKRPSRAVSLYEEQRLMKISPQEIVGMLAWQLHALALVVAAGDRTSSEIAAKSSLKPYTINKAKQIAKRTSLSDVKKYVNKLAIIDKKSKSQNYNIDAALVGYLIELGA